MMFYTRPPELCTKNVSFCWWLILLAVYSLLCSSSPPSSTEHETVNIDLIPNITRKGQEKKHSTSKHLSYSLHHLQRSKEEAFAVDFGVRRNALRPLCTTYFSVEPHNFSRTMYSLKFSKYFSLSHTLSLCNRRI